jgi:hypothetical protein
MASRALSFPAKPIFVQRQKETRRRNPARPLRVFASPRESFLAVTDPLRERFFVIRYSPKELIRAFSSAAG